MIKKPFVTKSQIEEIVKTYPTPFHLYDEAGIRKNAEDVKKAFAKEMGIKYDKLFKGQELINEHLLCYNNVENQSKIQVMVSKKES